MRHVKAIIPLAVILAISLAPAVALRYFPRETSAYMLGQLGQNLSAIWIVISFILAIVTASALLLISIREFLRHTRENH